MKFKFEEARADYAKARDGAERSYMALMADLKEHAATFGGQQPETAQAEEQRLRNKFPALNGRGSGLGAVDTEFRPTPDPAASQPTFTEAEAQA